MIRKRLTVIEKHQSIMPDGIPVEFLKLGREGMKP
jgi:hypothetical protein